MPSDEAFHAHVYFTPEARDSALRLADALRQALGHQVRVSSLREQPVGPHPLPMFTVVIPTGTLEPALQWLMLHHGDHSVLLHPQTGNDLVDHLRHPAGWGTPLPLRLEILAE